MNEKRRTLLQMLGASLSGCFFFCSVATFDIWPLAWVSLLPLLIAIKDSTPKRAFLLGWLTGTVTNVGGFYWTVGLLVRFGKLPIAVSIPAFLLLAAYQGLHWGVTTGLLRAIQRRRPHWKTAWLLPPLMVSFELWVPMVFDWYLAISQAWVPLIIQIAEFTGPTGVSFLILLCNGALFDAWQAWRKAHPLPISTLAYSGAIIAAALTFGVIRISQIDQRRQQAKKLKVGIVQSNIGIASRRGTRQRIADHAVHLRESRRLQADGAQLLVWSESSYPFAIERSRKQDFPASNYRQIMRGLKVPLIFGALSFAPTEPHPYNTAFMVNPQGKIVSRYDKNYLLIFGEHIPFYDWVPQFRRWVPAASHFTPGRKTVAFPFGRYRLGPMICYEDIIPAFGRRLAQHDPHLLVNITNDAWFGKTSEPYQHLALSVFRAVELRRDLVRSVNTGVSAFIDANGRLLAHTEAHDPRFEPLVKPERLLVDAALLDSDKTFYARFGDIFGYLNIALVLGLLFLAHRKTGKTA